MQAHTGLPLDTGQPNMCSPRGPLGAPPLNLRRQIDEACVRFAIAATRRRLERSLRARPDDIGAREHLWMRLHADQARRDLLEAGR